VSEASIGIIILAAGASSRLGQPKQLLLFEGETLLNRAVRVALETNCRPVIVVLGAHAETLQAELAATQARVVCNQGWNEGMSSSIRCGLQALEASDRQTIEAAILMLCDQPFITSDIIERLVETFLEHRSLLVVSEYETDGVKTRGVPALFSRPLFAELMELSGAAGAKRVIAQHEKEATIIAMPEAAFDVDTADDYLALNNSSGSVAKYGR
jgi:molybdenum cofactor cytidylyltransferase